MRQSGLLMHITSLPGPEGIGTLGHEAYDFVDFVKKSGCSVWQMLPIGPTGFGDSPYQSPSTFAGNPLIISIELLEEDGLLEKGSLIPGDGGSLVNFEKMNQDKNALLQRSFDQSYSKIKKMVSAFAKENSWVIPFAQYQALCEQYGHFYLWPVKARTYYVDHNKETASLLKSLTDRINFHAYVQYLFDDQWKRLKKYAEEQSIQFFGDMPIYVAPGSADIWQNPRLFQLDEKLEPKRVAGVPPDYFSEDGQLWGNPLYDWPKMREENYEWWISRLNRMKDLFDIVRIDHFIGFANYYSIPADSKTAKIGKWIVDGGKTFFKTVKKKLPELNIIAEDLGEVSDRVKDLLKFVGYPGMKVLLFCFGGDHTNPHRPDNIIENSVVYSGTHDNDTSLGWWNDADENMRKSAQYVLNIENGDHFAWEMVKTAFMSRANMAIVPVQDLLELDNSARMNIPGTVGGRNWRFRLGQGLLTEMEAEKLKKLNEQSGRMHE